jgi:hypothetical protein
MHTLFILFIAYTVIKGAYRWLTQRKPDPTMGGRLVVSTYSAAQLASRERMWRDIHAKQAAHRERVRADNRARDERACAELAKKNRVWREEEARRHARTLERMKDPSDPLYKDAAWWAS